MMWDGRAVGSVAELADARALGARGFIRAGSTPVAPTTFNFRLQISDCRFFWGRAMGIRVVEGVGLWKLAFRAASDFEN
jgi:hypothetical protein